MFDTMRALIREQVKHDVRVIWHKGEWYIFFPCSNEVGEDGERYFKDPFSERGAPIAEKDLRSHIERKRGSIYYLLRDVPSEEKKPPSKRGELPLIGFIDS